MNSLLALDQTVFLALNHLPHTAASIAAARFFSGIGAAGLVWFVIGVLLFLREEVKDHRFFIPIVVSGIASWVLVEDFLKLLVNRPRPSAAEGAWIFASHFGDASFPSGHTTIAWAMAIVLSHYEPKLRWYLYFLAFIISFSRIYLGVHYPLDVFGGFVLGCCIGMISLRLVPEYKRKKLRTARRH